MKIFFESSETLWDFITKEVKYKYRPNHQEKYVEFDDRDHNETKLINKAKVSPGYLKFSRK